MESGAVLAVGSLVVLALCVCQRKEEEGFLSQDISSLIAFLYLFATVAWYLLR